MCVCSVVLLRCDGGVGCVLSGVVFVYGLVLVVFLCFCLLLFMFAFFLFFLVVVLFCFCFLFLFFFFVLCFSAVCCGGCVVGVGGGG